MKNLLTVDSIPDASGPSQTLTSLNLAFNQLDSIPQLQNLLLAVTYLDLQGNNIQEKTVGNLTNATYIQTLDISQY